MNRAQNIDCRLEIAYEGISDFGLNVDIFGGVSEKGQFAPLFQGHLMGILSHLKEWKEML